MDTRSGGHERRRQRAAAAGLASARSPKHHRLTDADRAEGQRQRKLAFLRRLAGLSPRQCYRLGFSAGWSAARLNG